MKIRELFSPVQRIRADRDSAPLQVTFDARTPDVTRLHLIPLKTGLLKRSPSIVLINGWHMFLIGPSWADLLRTFILELEDKAEAGRRLSREELEPVLNATLEKIHPLYPTVPEEFLLEDLNEIVGLCIAVSHRTDVPPEIQADVSLPELAKSMKAPFRMDLLVSPMIESGEWQCPLHCKGCYATRQPGMVMDKSLSTEEWKAIIDRCRQAGIPQLTFTGGEPTRRADLVELVDYARWHVTRLNTNGVDLTAELVERLFHADLDAVQVTLYSADAGIHEELVGARGAWKKTVDGIKNSVKAGLSVSVNTPLVRANADYETTLKFISGLGVKYVTCSGLIPAGAAPGQIEAGAALSNEELLAVLRRAVGAAQALGLDLMFTSPGWLTKEQLAELGLSNPICGACLSNMAVMPNGSVAPCQSWLQDAAGLGNILATPWKEIWERPDCKKMRLSSPEGCPLKEIAGKEARK